MKKIMTPIVTVIALLTFSFAAVAQQNPARYFKRLDTNQMVLLRQMSLRSIQIFGWIKEAGQTKSDAQKCI